MITPDLVQRIDLLARLPEDYQQLIAERAADISLRPGDWLIQEGEQAAFFCLLDGAIDVIKSAGRIQQVVSSYQPGDYFGELPLLLGAPAIAGLIARQPTRVMRLDPSDFHSLIVGRPEISAELLQTMARRVGILHHVVVETATPSVRIIGRRNDLACHDVRDFLARNQLPFEWLDPDDPVGHNRIPPEYQAPEVCPIVLLADGSALITPTPRQLAQRLDLQTTPRSDAYDLAIIGGGPAGLAAAVYGASEGLRTVLVEQEAPGGQAGTSSRIENYLGFPTGLSGEDLSRRAWHQAKRFGAEILVTRRACGIVHNPEDRCLILDDGDRIRATAVVIAAGVAWRHLNVPGLSRFVGRGVYYGAARTEAPNVRGRDVYLVGGGNSAGQAAMFFANYASRVTLLVRAESLESTMSRYLIDQLATKSNVDIQPWSEVVAVNGSDHLESLTVCDTRSRETRTVFTDALSVFIGADAQTEWLPTAILRDDRGYVVTGPEIVAASTTNPWPLSRDPYLLETSIPGIFAAGDVRSGSIKRVASGVGEGSMAIAFVHQYLASIADTISS